MLNSVRSKIMLYLLQDGYKRCLYHETMRWRTAQLRKAAQEFDLLVSPRPNGRPLSPSQYHLTTSARKQAAKPRGSKYSKGLTILHHFETILGPIWDWSQIPYPQWLLGPEPLNLGYLGPLEPDPRPARPLSGSKK